MRSRYAWIVLLTVALLGSACSKKELASVLTKLGITTSEYSFAGAPATTKGGVVEMTVTNAGKQPHEASMVELKDAAKGKDDLIKAFPGLMQGQPFPAWIGRFTGLGEVKAGSTYTGRFTLPVGRFLLVCTLSDEGPDGEGIEGAKSHLELGMATEVTVTDAPAGAPTAPDGTIVAKDYTFEVPALTAGKRSLVFRNAGPMADHFAVVFEFAAGVDVPGAEKIVAGLLSEAGPPEGTVPPKDIATTAAYSPDLAGTFDVTFQTGRTYGLACFLSDRTGGPPHAVGKKMTTVFAVA